MDKLKTNQQISKGAESLYSEHKALNKQMDSIENFTSFMDEMKPTASELHDANLESDINTPIRAANFDKHLVEVKIEENQSAAEHYSAKNPRLFGVAVKAAMRDGIEINTK